jgi:chemotaxis protein methyltransferase CheR
MMLEVGLNEITRIVDAIYKSTGTDFSNYAFSSFRRRIERFIEINKIRDLNMFLETITNDSSFSQRLVNEITVNVTEMFRDPSFWVVLRDSVLPKLASSGSGIRIWHAACATGEEVYSMAILLKEEGLSRHARITATDLNNEVIRTAEKGVYLLKNQTINYRNYEQFGGKGKLDDYYTVQHNKVQFDRRLVENVQFGYHDLVHGEPISSFDLILCRNVLIYFNFELQEKVVQTFAKSMTTGSFLAIGSKESISWSRSARLFEPESHEEKIYKKNSIESPNNLVYCQNEKN